MWEFFHTCIIVLNREDVVPLDWCGWCCDDITLLHFLCLFVEGPIMHHKAVLLCNQRVLVTGGRSSPHKPSDGLYTLSITASTGEWKKVRISDNSDEMEPRWRHSATVIQYNGKHFIIPTRNTCTFNCWHVTGIIIVQFPFLVHYIRASTYRDLGCT